LPFIGSILLVGVGLFVRLKIEETESFTAAKRSGAIAKLPVLEVFTRQPREIVLGAFMTTTVFGFFYIGVTYLTTYGTAVLEHPRTTVLALGILGGTVFAVTTIIGSIWSDKAGRRKLVLSGNIASIAIGTIAFPVLDTGSACAFGLGLCLVLGVVGFAYGPVGAMLPELFSAQYRYTGAGLAYNLAGVLGGAVTPLVATALVGSFGSNALGIYLAFLALVSTLATLGLRDTRHVDMVTVVPPATAAEDLQGAPH
jgi:MFS family permease